MKTFLRFFLAFSLKKHASREKRTRITGRVDENEVKVIKELNSRAQA